MSNKNKWLRPVVRSAQDASGAAQFVDAELKELHKRALAKLKTAKRRYWSALLARDSSHKAKLKELFKAIRVEGNVRKAREVAIEASTLLSSANEAWQEVVQDLQESK